MTITYEQIAERAFEIWKKEGEVEGREQEHWAKAEAQLREECLQAQRGKKISSRDPAMFKTTMPHDKNVSQKN